MGEAAARTALEALEGAEALPGSLTLRSQPVHIPLGTSRLPPMARLLLGRGQPLLRGASRYGLLHRLARRAAAKGGTTPSQGAQTIAGLAMLSEQGLVSRGGRPHVPTRVAALEMGSSLRGVTVPGEAVTRLGLPLKDALGSPYRLFLGLTYDTLGYLIPADEWMTAPAGSYEESVSLGRQAGPTVSAALLDLIGQTSGPT